MDRGRNIYNFGNINNRIKGDGVNTMDNNETAQARIERLRRYQEQQDKEDDERRREESLRFYTIGYAGLSSIQDLEEIMEKHSITLIVDVRSKPNTKRFSRKDLFATFDLKYESRPEMGGFSHTKDQYEDWLVSADEGLKALLAAANSGIKVLIMCAEKNPDVCHRKYFVARALEEGGHKVKHL